MSAHDLEPKIGDGDEGGGLSPFESLAARVSDGDEVDWQEQSDSIPSDEERNMLAHLRVVAGIAEFHRDSQKLAAPREDAAGTARDVEPSARDGAIAGIVHGHLAELAMRRPDADAAVHTDRPAADGADRNAMDRAASPKDARSESASPGRVGMPTRGLADRTPDANARAAQGSKTPRHWGPLELRDRLGRGGFGEVYRAYDRTLERDIALKLLRSRRAPVPPVAGKPNSSRTEEALLREGRLLARLRHPNIVTIYGADRHDDRVGLWMELIRGRSLAEIVRAQGPLGADEALNVGMNVCSALAAVHQTGLVHRDVKAQNVMREDGGRIVLMDLGLGRESGDEFDGVASEEPIESAPISGRSAVGAIDVRKERAGAGPESPPLPASRPTEPAPMSARTDLVSPASRPTEPAPTSARTDLVSPAYPPPMDLAGTPLYMTPELLAGKTATPAADLYALGVMLYYLVTSEFPIEASDLPSLRQAHFEGKRRSLRDARPDLPREFVEVVERAIAKDPEGRFRTAGEMEQALMSAAERLRMPANSGHSTRGAIGAVETAKDAQFDSTSGTSNTALHKRGFSLVGMAKTPGGRRVLIAISVILGVVIATSIAALRSGYDVSASIYRVDGSGTRERLDNGDAVSVGDYLGLEVRGSRDLFTYVVSTDDRGEAYLLFPLPGFSPQNPLPGGDRHMLPGRFNEQKLYWQVSSSGGRERFLIVTSPERLNELEESLGQLRTPSEPTMATELTESARARLRGIGWMGAPSANARPASARENETVQKVRQLVDGDDERARGLWAREVVLTNE